MNYELYCCHIYMYLYLYASILIVLSYKPFSFRNAINIAGRFIIWCISEARDNVEKRELFVDINLESHYEYEYNASRAYRYWFIRNSPLVNLPTLITVGSWLATAKIGHPMATLDRRLRKEERCFALLHGEAARLKSPPSDNWGGPCAATAPRSGRSPRNWENEPWAAPLSRPPCVGAELPWYRRRRIILDCRGPRWNFHVRNKRRFRSFVMSKRVDAKTRERKHCNCNNLSSVFCCVFCWKKFIRKKFLSCDNIDKIQKEKFRSFIILHQIALNWSKNLDLYLFKIKTFGTCFWCKQYIFSQSEKLAFPGASKMVLDSNVLRRE